MPVMLSGLSGLVERSMTASKVKQHFSSTLSLRSTAHVVSCMNRVFPVGVLRHPRFGLTLPTYGFEIVVANGENSPLATMLSTLFNNHAMPNAVVKKS